MKLDRIYTRSGDDGRTSLGDGARLTKFHVRVAACGGIDEANAVIGMALLHIADAAVRDRLLRVQICSSSWRAISTTRAGPTGSGSRACTARRTAAAYPRMRPIPSSAAPLPHE
jgi:hypothetical protein